MSAASILKSDVCGLVLLILYAEFAGYGVKPHRIEFDSRIQFGYEPQPAMEPRDGHSIDIKV
jgi:hypothetical protein